jgi:TnpA family transposase
MPQGGKMPVEFLTKEQEQNYGRYTQDPSKAQLVRYFHLSDTDIAFIAQRRRAHNRLGFAVQLGTVRFLGTFLANPSDVPTVVVDYLCRQLSITDPKCLSRYARSDIRVRHAAEIKQVLGYHDFSEPLQYLNLLRWLYTRASVSDERPSVLLDLATARLVERKVLLPGVTVLARLISRVRARVANRLWRTLASKLTKAQRAKLQGLLAVNPATGNSDLDRLRRAPTRVSGPALVSALNRLEEIRGLGVSNLALTGVPAGRVKALARHAAAVRAQAIARMPSQRQLATLLAFAQQFERRSMDDSLDVLEMLWTSMTRDAKNQGKKERIRTLSELDAAARRLKAAADVLLDDDVDGQNVRQEVFLSVPKAELREASLTIGTLTRPKEDNYYPELIEKYRTVRRFLPTLLRTVKFSGTQAGQPVQKAVQFLASIEGQRRSSMNNAPLEVVSKAWRPHVITSRGDVDRPAYTLCVLDSLIEGLRRRDLFVEKSDKFSDPQQKLLSGADWDAARPKILSALGRRASAKEELAMLSDELDAAFRRTAENLPTNAAISIEDEDGRQTLTVSGLDKLDQPPSLVALRQQVADLLPRVDLPEVLLEIHGRTGFASEFTHISEAHTRVADLPISICAVLLAEACNIGLQPIVKRDIPALTRDRLTWVQQNYIRAETLTKANARLVDYQANIPLAKTWGGGEVASADGLRFIVPVRTINAGPNPKYFSAGRGVTLYNFTSNQFTEFHRIVIPGTLRDSLYILEGLLEQETGLNPVEIMADTAGVSDVVFGLFWLLGYQFSPRLADVGEARFWRMDASADYGLLNGLARQRISERLISRNYDDMLRVAGSLKMGTVKARELLTSLLRSKRPSTLARAIAELGRIPKTLYLLNYVDDENYRRHILTQLNRHEKRHDLSRVTFHGKRGELRKRYREGQEDQLSSLGLVVNVIVLFNTLYMEAALKQLRNTGVEVSDSDRKRLWPLGHHHLNFLGRYSFTLPKRVANGQLRPLSTPQDMEL